MLSLDVDNKLGPSLIQKSSFQNDQLRLSDIKITQDENDPDKSNYETLADAGDKNADNFISANDVEITS
jgi:hypothetical protein